MTDRWEGLPDSRHCGPGQAAKAWSGGWYDEVDAWQFPSCGAEQIRGMGVEGGRRESG